MKYYALLVWILEEPEERFNNLPPGVDRNELLQTVDEKLLKLSAIRKSIHKDINSQVTYENVIRFHPRP